MAAKIKTPVHHRHRRLKHKPRGVAKRDFEKVYWPYLPLILVVGLLMSLGIQSGAIQSGLRNPAGQTLDYAISMNINRLLDETNGERTRHGASPLRLNAKLYAAAQAKADDMAAKNYWSHYTPSGEAPWVFVINQDYDYQKLGENLATGFLNEKGTINGWMASQGHRRNLLDPVFSEVGFGIANNPNYSSAGGGPMTIIVAMYGKPLVASATTSSSLPATTISPSQADDQKTALAVPANTETLGAGSSDIKTYKLSGAQLALASLPFGQIATSLLLLVMLAAGALWLTKHAFALKRMWLNGEAFIVKHPLLDAGLLITVLLAFLLTRTAGLVG